MSKGESSLPTPRERESTQQFVALDTMMRHVGKTLTPELAGKIAAEYVEEFRRGPCAWAFSSVSETQRWIAVTERLPSDPRDMVICLAFSPTNSDEDDSLPGAFVASFDDGEWHSRMDSGCWEPGEVTHWMPFPGGPK